LSIPAPRFPQPIRRISPKEELYEIVARKYDRIQKTTGEGCDSKGISGIDAIHDEFEEPL
jgi:hypothetical protein